MNQCAFKHSASELAIERLDERIVGWFAWSRQVECHPKPLTNSEIATAFVQAKGNGDVALAALARRVRAI
jgi:hypothetical protein